MTGKKILLVEDDLNVQLFNKELLEGRGFAVITVLTLSEAELAVSKHTPDAIVLDIGLPDGNGLEFLRKLRKTSKIPVLLLTGYGKDEDIIAGFESGCNDYLAKPYTFEVFLVRLKNLLQGVERLPDTISIGALNLDLLAHRALIDGNDLFLTDKEFSLIHLLVQNEDKVMEADTIYEKIWGQPMAGDRNALQVAITRLRKKLEPAGYSIVSLRGKGYMLAQG